MRDYYKTRIWALKSKRIHDNLYSDTFYSSLSSVRGYTCFQLLAFKKTKLVKIILMRRESQASEAYEDVIRSIGTPIKTITDISRAQTDSKWTNINRRCCIETGLTVPHHQHQNYSENEGGNFKFKVLKLLQNTTHAPTLYWCYATEFLDQVASYLSKRILRNRAPLEKP